MNLLRGSTNFAIENFYSDGEKKESVNISKEISRVTIYGEVAEIAGSGLERESTGIGVKGEIARNSGTSVTFYGALRRNLDAFGFTVLMREGKILRRAWQAVSIDRPVVSLPIKLWDAYTHRGGGMCKLNVPTCNFRRKSMRESRKKCYSLSQTRLSTIRLITCPRFISLRARYIAVVSTSEFRPLD